MNNFSEVWMIMLAGCLFVIGLNFLGKRFLNSFEKEIEAYLKSKRLTLKIKRKPKNSDWKQSPFKKPPAITFGIGRITVLGTTIPANETRYFILETHENVAIWLKAELSIFSKVQLEFKQSSLGV